MLAVLCEEDKDDVRRRWGWFDADGSHTPDRRIVTASMIFSTFSNFLGREKCYLILALINILYLMFVLSSLGTFSTSLIAIFFDYFTVHIVYLLLLSSLFFKRTKRFLGYEGL